MGKLVQKIVGVICLVAGLATLWLPIPTGLVLIVAGLSLLIVSSPYVAAWLRLLRRRYAGLDAKLSGAEPLLPGPLQRALARTRARRAATMPKAAIPAKR